MGLPSRFRLFEQGRWKIKISTLLETHRPQWQPAIQVVSDLCYYCNRLFWPSDRYSHCGTTDNWQLTFELTSDHDLWTDNWSDLWPKHERQRRSLQPAKIQPPLSNLVFHAVYSLLWCQQMRPSTHDEWRTNREYNNSRAVRRMRNCWIWNANCARRHNITTNKRKCAIWSIYVDLAVEM